MADAILHVLERPGALDILIDMFGSQVSAQLNTSRLARSEACRAGKPWAGPAGAYRRQKRGSVHVYVSAPAVLGS